MYGSDSEASHAGERDVTLPVGKTAVIVVDMQNDYCRPESDAFVGETILPTIGHIQSLLGLARRHDVPVLFTEMVCPMDDPNIRDHPRIQSMTPAHINGVIRGTAGTKTIDELKPRKTEAVLEKASSDPWFSTRLEEILQEMSFGRFEHGSVFHNRVTNDCNVIVTGTESDWCVDKAVIGLYLRGYQVVIPVDCISAPCDFRQKSALYRFSNQYLSIMTRADRIRFG